VLLVSLIGLPTQQKINRIAEPPKSHRQMTVFVLTLASIGSAYSVEEVKNGLETVKEKDLKNYQKSPPV
jgi:ABC-type amino acid transport system permease subunit